MWLDPDTLVDQLDFYLDITPIVAINATDPNYERNAFQGNLYRHRNTVKAVVIHETGMPNTTATNHKDKSLTHILFGTKHEGSNLNYRAYNAYIDKACQVYVTFFYPTCHITHSPQLWDIPPDELAQYSIGIALEGHNDITEQQVDTASKVCAAVMDVVKLEDNRIVSDLEDDINWLKRVKKIRWSNDVAGQDEGLLDQLETDEQISEPPDQHI